ncbi:sugar kinase [Actinotalea sp. Marseille-Q4924]|uniref:sugar kinase n=1 Tax=Actinotalea sp. Marseille-Q4924 TaxID=2866571 RepID=UPI001CE45B34|nr:sugar kinase [Actinotalea sp. Marseille-Q4924]
MSTLDVLTIGETMVSFRSDGPLGQGSRHTAHVAGAESNVAIGLARLGHRAAWVGQVGADPFGHMVLRALRGEGVDVSRAVVDGTGPTGVMFLEQRTADRTRVEYRRRGSAGSALDARQALAALDDGPRVLHLTGITPALSGSARDAVLAVADAASSSGVLVSLDVNHRSRLWSREEAKEVLTVLARHAQVVIASEDELDLVAGGGEVDAVAHLLDHGAQHVAVKRGARGATVHGTGGRVDADALPVTQVDPVGAGDAFCSGLLSGLLDGLAPDAALRRAVTCGAVAVSTHGDWEGAPTRADLDLLDEGDTTVR